MNFHQWPLHGTGSNSYMDDSGTIQGAHSADFSDVYDWGAMQNAYGAYTANPEVAENAVGELMYELGVAVEADYEANGTSASTFNLGNRLSSFFYYESVATHSSLAALTSPLEADLRAGFPCIVAIPGHAIVADGLMVDSGVTTYHINYGWGGTNNGWWLANNVAGDALDDGVTSIRPQLIAFPKESSVTGVVDQAVEVQWILPKRLEAEADTLTLYNLAQQLSGLWSSDASVLPSDNVGWSISAEGRNNSNCWYSGVNGLVSIVLDEVLVPDNSTSLSFWVKYQLYANTFTLSVSTDGGDTFTSLMSLVGNQYVGTDFEHKSVSLAAYAGQQVILRFILPYGNPWYTTGGVWIDDLSVNSGTWYNWEEFYTDTTLASRRFSSTESEMDDCHDFSVFEITSTSTYKDWICAPTGGVENCFYKEPTGEFYTPYTLTSHATITPNTNSFLKVRTKYKLSTETFKIYISFDKVNFTEVWMISNSDSDWMNIDVDLSPYAGQGIYIRFEYIYSGSYYATGGVWIDTVGTQVVTNPELVGQPIHYTEIPASPVGVHTLKAVLTDTSMVEHAFGPSFTLSVYDNDGMPTWWEELYGFNPFLDDSTDDSDTDTFSNLDEYIAGSNPWQSSSFFALNIQGHTISWPAISDRTYRVWYADHPAGPYNVLQTLPGPTSSFTDNSGAPKRFYKVDVSQ